MNFLFIIAFVYLFLKFKDITKDISDLNNRFDNLDTFVDRMEASYEDEKESQ